MPRPSRLRAATTIAFGALLSISLTQSASATNHPRGSSPAALRLVSPAPGERVAEATARLDVQGSGLREVRIVTSRESFDASGWTSVPTGDAWRVAPYDGSPVALAGGLSFGPRVETSLWWAAVGTDAASGRLVTSEVRRLVLVPRFANRVAGPHQVIPNASGTVPLIEAAASTPTYRAIRLASGDVVVPDPPARATAARASAAAPDGSGRRASLVQFADDSADSARARIERSGGTIVSPISGDAWLVRMDDGARARLAAGPGSAWIGEWQAGYKLSTLLDRNAAAPIEATALLFPDADLQASAAALAQLGASGVRPQRGSVNQLVTFTLDPARLGEAAALADVEWVEPAAHDSLLNDQAQWVLQSNVPNQRRIWDMGLRGQGQVVMSSDSGIRANHEMFFDSTVTISTWGDYPTHRKIIAYKPGSDSPAIQFGDDVGSEYHGTHTAGTVAGNADATSGAPWSGMAKDAKLYFMDMSGPSIGGTLATPADLNDLFEPSYAGNAGGAARISTNSWGNSASYGHYLIQSMQVDQFMWNHPDYLIAFAAGNIGALGTVQAPGTAKDCITVGATGNGTLAGQLAAFSSGGPTSDVRYKPTLCAPGDLVTSSIGSTRYTYATYSGTSMATPAVAGTMALLREYLTEGWYPTGAPVAANAFTPSAALLKAMAMCASRNDIIPYTSPNNHSGWGRLTADDVLYFPGDSSRTMLVDATNGMTDHQYVEYQVQVTDPSRPLKVVLCWTDAPGNPVSATQIVNDLDLSVTNGANTYLGNRLLNFNSATGGLRDSLNVEEVVRLAAPVAGLYTVRVEGHRVLQGPQPFGLCVTGGVGLDAGAIALDRFEYGLTDTLGVEVIDANAVSPLTVTLRSTTEGDYPEFVQLTGANGVFRGRFAIGPAVPRSGDGVLAVSSGDRITATYVGAAPAVSVTASAQVNAQLPVITNVHARSLSQHTALVTWSTDVAASSRVRYGVASVATAHRDSTGYTKQHSVLLSGLAPGATYRYDVESDTPFGETSVDSVGGQHRLITTGTRGDLLLVMDDPSAATLDTWTNALASLGWTADVITNAEDDPPLVGNASAGMRSYAAVLWQVDPDRYPPFSDAQRSAIDSLLQGGGRLLVTGHDIGWGLSDAGSPSYSEARELWLESALKTRYYGDVSWADTLRGVAGDPVTGDFTGGVKYHPEMYPDAGDAIGPAPSSDGSPVRDWYDDYAPTPDGMGIRWESAAVRGVAGSGVWGGKSSRLVDMFYEWRALSTTTSASATARTGVLERSVEWLVGHRPPVTLVTVPAPGSTVTADFLAIRYVTAPDANRAIASRSLDYSLDGGESWASITTAATADSGYIWDLGAALGGVPVQNSNRALVRLTALDDGSPAMRDTYVLPGTFTLSRPTGDTRGPVLVAGSAGTSPTPLQRGSVGVLLATFSDAETGAGTVVAAEYSLGAAPATPGSGTAMSGSFGAGSVAATADLNTSSIGAGTQSIWLRARDAAGNWGPASQLAVIANDRGVLAVESPTTVDFLGTASPNPSFGAATLRFGLARAGSVRLELFDVAGRRVRALVDAHLGAGVHAVEWDGRDESANPVHAGVFFVRLVTPSRTFQSRLVRLE